MEGSKVAGKCIFHCELSAPLYYGIKSGAGRPVYSALLIKKIFKSVKALKHWFFTQSKRRPRRPSLAAAILILLISTALYFPRTTADTLAQIKSSNNLNIDQSAISISGLSSGGFMAVQYHLAHSSELTGVASVAGGPYHCAATPSFFCDYMLWFLPRGVCNASYRCTATAKKLLPFGFYLGPPDYEDSVDSALAQADAGLIDPLTGLNDDRIWIFTSGQPNKTPRDTLVPHEIAVQLKDFYQALYNQSEAVEAGDLEFVDTVQAEHSMVIDDPTRDDNCDAFGHPFIDDCSYNTAQQLLDHLYPNSIKQPATSQGQLLSFDQQALPRATMADTGHIYIPAACQQTSCPLHIALHGCGQTQSMIDAALPEPERLYFYRDTGYNDWADAANVVMLYPQAAASEDNENGCWDWWGYSSEDFHNQRAPQIQSIRSMVQALTRTR